MIYKGCRDEVILVTSNPILGPGCIRRNQAIRAWERGMATLVQRSGNSAKNRIKMLLGPPPVPVQVPRARVRVSFLLQDL